MVRVAIILTGLQAAELHQTALGLGATFLRVNLALFLAALWTIPAGVAIGLNPRLARIAQPLAQIAASVPATALLPVILLVLDPHWWRPWNRIHCRSVARDAMVCAVQCDRRSDGDPTDLKECCSVFQVRGIERWKKLILPGIFPYLVTGMVTASGGAWNATIVAEYFHFKGHIYTTTGLGATISQATDAGDFKMLIAATIVMAATVVTVNRLVWRKLFVLAETRFRLET